MHPRKDDLRLLLQTGLSRGTTSTTTGCRDIDSGPAPETMHRLLISTTTTTSCETDEARRHGRVLLMFQLHYTDEAMDNADADAHVYTTTIIMHGEREAKTEDDDHSSLIGGTLAS